MKVAKLNTLIDATKLELEKARAILPMNDASRELKNYLIDARGSLRECKELVQTQTCEMDYERQLEALETAAQVLTALNNSKEIDEEPLSVLFKPTAAHYSAMISNLIVEW
ncbi:hypothetical protein VH22019_00063 [Vibrio phage VH2_2019]|nr:hypothetical protein VH22019_00063 [Vibrio phage VH2_2019]